MAVAFFWLVFLSLPISFCVTAIEYEVVIDFGKDAQESEACSFPEVLKIRMKSYPPFKGSMTLRRKDEIDTDAPAYAIHTGENGVTRFTEIGLRSTVKKTVAYQSLEYGAAFLVRCKNKRFQIEGTVYLDGKKYRVKAAPTHRKLQRPNKHAVLHVFTPITETGHSDQQLLNSMRERHETYRPLKEPQWTKNDNSDRVKRATEKKKYYIDVLAIFDYAFYQFWLTQAIGDANNATTMSKEYVAYMFNGINARFDTITSAVFSISVQLSGFIIATTKQTSSWTESIKEEAANASIPQVNADSVLINLETWTNKTRSSFPVADVDHVMLFTGYDLYGNDNGFRFNNTAGFALVGTMCYTDGRSVSVVEDHGGYQSETTATHELGHSLGAKHDGSSNPCSSADRYVMAGEPSEETPANRRNPWQFSSCSVDYFSTHVKALGSEGFEPSCLLKKSNAKDVPTVDGLPGQRSGPDAQCRQIYGSKSYLCRGTNFGKPEDVCLSMFCRNPNTDATCTINTAAPGTCCGNGKWCVNGQCVNATGENKCYMSETCPFGQRQGPVIGVLTCDQLDAGYCYNSNFQQVCCEMCDKKHRNAPGCEYGDKVTECNRTYCGSRYPNGDLYDVQCCGTCAFTPPTTTTLMPPITTSTTTTPFKPIDDLNVCKDVALINSTTCPSFLDKNGLLYCCKANVQRFCCDTCTRRKSSDPTCEFGDCDPGCATTNIFQVRTIPCDDVLRKKCCKSCQNLDSRLTTKTAITTTTTTTKTAITTTTTTTTKASAIVTTAKPGVDVTTTTKAAVTTTTTTKSTTTKAGATVTTATPGADVTTAKPGVDVSTTKKTAVTTTTTKTSVNKPLCRPLLGVRTCSGNRISANSVLALTILVMALTKVLR